MATGIRTRHARSCRSQDGGRCNCDPSYEAWVYSKRDGKKIRRTFTNLQTARSWRHDAGTQVVRGTMRTPSRLSLEQAADTWLAGARDGSIRNRSGDRYKPSAVRGYEQALRLRLLPELGGARLVELARRDVQALVGRMQAGSLDPSTIRNTLLPLRAIYRHHADDAPVNPTVGVRLPAARGRRDRIVAPDQAVDLLMALNERDRVLYATAMYAGLRLGELRALRWADVDLGSGVIRVERSWDPREGVIDPKSRAGRRRVPIVPVLRQLLVDHRMRGTGEGWVFGTDDRPLQPSSSDARAKRAWKAAGLERITLHEARHTFASLMIAAGVNAKALATYMGHSSVTITFDRYGHLMPGNEDEAATLLGAYLERADTRARLAAVASD